MISLASPPSLTLAAESGVSMKAWPKESQWKNGSMYKRKWKFMKAFEGEIESQCAVQSESRSKSLQQKFIKKSLKEKLKSFKKLYESL